MLAFATEFGLFETFKPTTRAEKNVFVNHNETYD